MSKVTEAIFQALPVNGKLEVSNKDDFTKYLLENEGVLQSTTLKPASRIGDLQKMYSFLHGPLLSCAIQAFTHAGMVGVDKVKARYILEAELCKAEIFNPKTGKVHIYIESVSGMNKQRLLKFIVDVIFYLETEFNQITPNSEEFKVWLRTGKKMKIIK
ncbi:MAG TPA: hypothetical protein ACFYEK_01275 [Candidatus Wunengus sp. YC60]|uniref:hypothetical protein n=1 Tax=Candidatus Wunengus sp. YC60 TaxID=3367697 RepID=UPI00402A56BF